MGGNCRCANGDSILALVTESHFFGYDSITGIRILVAVIAFSAGVTSAYAPGSRITDLRTGTEQSVVRTGGIIRRVYTLIVDLVASIHGTADTVITIDRCAG
jgi:hypothetical protein